MNDRLAYGPMRSTLHGFSEADPAYWFFIENPREIFTTVECMSPDILPCLGGLTLQPRLPGILRRAMAANNIRPAILNEKQAVTVLINAIRNHRQDHFRFATSRKFNEWVQQHYCKSNASMMPLLYHRLVEPEIKKTVHMIGASSAMKEVA